MLHTAIADILRGQESVRRATAHIEWQADPATPGRTAYRITGATRDVVQNAISARMEAAERLDGNSEFTHPERIIDGWLSLGYVLLPQPVAA